MADLPSAGLMTGAAARPQWRQIEGMRALAALVVYVNHAYAQAGFPGHGSDADGIWPALEYSLVAGHLSVTVFIVISGFCLALPVVASGGVQSGGARRFLERRARRILPPYYAAVAFCLILIWTILGKPTGTIWDVPIQVTSVTVVSHLLLLQDLFATGGINYVFWSIAVEWQIYFLFPFLVAGFRRFGPLAATGGALLLGFALRVAFGDTRIARANPHYMGMFALGMLAAHLARSSYPLFVHARQRIPWHTIAAISLVTVCALSRSWGVSLSDRRFFLLDLPTGILAMAVLVVTSRGESGFLSRALSSRPLVFIGTFSYSLYLVHAPLLQILWQFVLSPAQLGARAMFVLLMTVGLAVVLACSFLFFRLFEQPFMHSARQSIAARDRATPLSAA